MESYYIRFTVLLLVWIFLQLGVATYWFGLIGSEHDEMRLRELLEKSSF